MYQQHRGQQWDQQMGQQGINRQQSRIAVSDKDLADRVLSELKRVAAEYTIACMEANNQDIRHLFEQALHQTLHDQGQLYQIMRRLNLYGQPLSAQHRDMHQEAQHHQQQLNELQSFMHQGGIGGMQQQTAFQSQTGFGNSAYASTAGDGAYGHVDTASTMQTYGNMPATTADMYQSSSAPETYTTGSGQNMSHTTGAHSIQQKRHINHQ